MTYRKKLIEVGLPLPEINDASAYDKMPGIGAHPKGIHQWWARLPLPTARAVLFASVVDDPSSHPDKYPTEEAQKTQREKLFHMLRNLMQKKAHDHPEFYAEAREEMLKHCEGKLPPVLDPFAGGGSIPLEAARLGFKVHAADLNPIAVLLNKCNLELVPRWVEQSPVNPVSRGERLPEHGWKGASGLAEDVRYYGGLIQERAVERIGHLYPKVKLTKEYGGGEASVVAWLWARTIRCPNPACRARAPLLRSFWLCKRKARRVHLKPTTKGTNLTFEIRTEGDAERPTTSGKGARCLHCGEPISKAEARAAAVKHGVREIPVALVADSGKGRLYLPPDLLVLPTIDRPNLPAIEKEMTNDRRWFSPPLYGLPRFSDVFTARQLTAMTTLNELIKVIRQDIERDALATGLPQAKSVDYATTVTTFLALALDRCADFNCALSTWKPSGEQQMHLFTRQAIPMVWDFAEANLLGSKAICWSNAVDITSSAIASIPVAGMAHGACYQLDAAGSWDGLTALLVSTDPPYYDNIGYAALSDFFYVWLRCTIGKLYPDLFSTILVPKGAELTASPERFDGDKEEAKKHFETGFRKAFSALRDKMDPRFPLTVYYAFRQEDEESGEDEVEEVAPGGSSRTTGWETLLEALLSSGFQITATWPVRASQKWRMVAMGTNALASYIVLACRPRPADASQCSRREFSNELKKELPAALRGLRQGNIAPVDFAQASIGPGMAVFSRYARVVESSGKSMSVRTALSLINQTLSEVLAEQEGEYDADTRWAIAWFEQHGTAEGAFGDAEILSKAKNTAVNGLVEAGIIHAKAGKVRLLRREELLEDWDPANDRRLTLWECTQYLVLQHGANGDDGAARLVAKLGGGISEEARNLAYRLYSICDRKKWSREAQVYNSLVIAWPEIMGRAQRIPAPPEQGRMSL